MRAKIIGIGGALALANITAAQAHPHSFITLHTAIVAENGQMTGLKMRWTMDEITSADLLYDAGNAAPGSPVWKKLAAEVMANVLAQHYFTEFWHNGRKVKFAGSPMEYGLGREEHQAVLSFVLPLAEPQPLAGQNYTFSTFDPTYYVDMYYEEAGALTLPDALQSACSVTLHTPKPNADIQAYALALDKEDAPQEDMELGKQFAQQVTLTCR
ncbi:DUF1007 family protein [Entomohabitans teleogrylli]|uniref:DUF1007 family protein n=1 Tax=Entomohabitans teleogrylli TaxID=1384589 RepID=UPI00073D546F|nr:DUF1007 family protein [Entomohabitans teleogrylli]